MQNFILIDLTSGDGEDWGIYEGAIIVETVYLYVIA